MSGRAPKSNAPQVSARPSGPRSRGSEARREITERAARFLSDRPFRDLTVGALMAGTSLSRPAFYQYFTDIHDLIETLLGELEIAMRETANPWLAGSGEPISALRDSLRGIVQVCVTHGPVFRAITEAAPMDGRLERAWSGFMQRWDDAVEARIKAQQGAGIVPVLDARHIARALNRLDQAVLIDEFGRAPQGDPETVLNTLHRIWVGTLYGQS